MSVIVPMVLVLVSMQTYIFVEKMLDEYKQNLINDYSIIIATNKKVTLDNFNQKNIKHIKQIEVNSTIDNIKNSISKINFKLLESKIPNFYNVTLKYLPNQRELESIKSELAKYTFVKRVEVFSKTHEKLYNFFMLNSYLTKLFFYSILILSVLLIIKQIEIWKQKNSQKLYVMSLFGAGEFIKSAELIKKYFIYAIVSLFLASLIFIYLENNKIFKLVLSNLGIDNISFGIIDFRNLFLFSLLIVAFSLLFVVVRHKK
jgi:cell division transport system permease protein